MPQITFTRRETFSAAHRLWQTELSPEENKKLYGKCVNIHGHNYILEVTIAGEIQKESGTVVDLKKLKEIIHSEIIRKVDHTYLNKDVDFLSGINPTTENLARVFWDILFPLFPAGSLRTLRLYETEKNYVEIRGDELSDR